MKKAFAVTLNIILVSLIIIFTYLNIKAVLPNFLNSFASYNPEDKFSNGMYIFVIALPFGVGIHLYYKFKYSRSKK